MAVLRFDSIDFSFDDMLKNLRQKNGGREVSEEMARAAEEAYREGSKVLDLRSSVEIYGSRDCGKNYIALTRCGAEPERIYIGPKAGYLIPALEAAVVLSSAGAGITDLMNRYGEEGDYLTMYYLDAFGVQALAEVSQKARAFVESAASAKGWGVGPSMQPGSVDGWGVEGQRDLFRLGRGSEIGLDINDSSFLIPHISNSALIGIGPHYSAEKSGSLCRECPRWGDCLWSRENTL